MASINLERRLQIKRLGFSEDPFMSSADPRFLYLSSQHGEVLEKARYVIEGFRGLAVVEGGYGVGKSSLALRLESIYRGMPDDFKVIYVHTASYESEFAGLQDICDFVNIPRKRGLTKQWRALEGFLVDQHEQGRNVVVILDDAQLMSPDALRIVHTLFNFERHGHKLVQVILFGQPELGYSFVMYPEIRSRVHSWFRLNPLSIEDTIDLINFRCMVAGRKSTFLTSQKGFLDLYEATEGTPREVVTLCSQIIDLLGSTNKQVADEKIVEQAIEKYLELRSDLAMSLIRDAQGDEK